MRRRRTFHPILSLLLLAVLLRPVMAQSERAVVTGRVTDSSGAVVAGAEVTATEIGTNRSVSTVTTKKGRYVLADLQPGRYRIVVVKDGFRQTVGTRIALRVQDNIAQNFELQIGSVAESVTVVAAQENFQQSPSVGTVIDRGFVDNIPLNGRTFQALIALAPGVVITKADSNNQGQFSVNGQRANANTISIDGVSANVAGDTSIGLGQAAGGSLPAVTALGTTSNLVSIDALAEFKIQTSAFSPEFGHTPGGQISIVTRSGTNSFHGTLFEYFRNEALDANDWFSNRLGLHKAPLRQNDFGGVFGGHIVKDRTFFFASYEQLILRLPQTRTSTVPSLASRQAASPELKPWLDAYPTPNGPDTINGESIFSANYADPSVVHAGSIRVDQTLPEHGSFFVRYNYAPSSSSRRRSALSDVVNSTLDTQTLTGGYTWALNPTLGIDVRLNYSRVQGSSTFNVDSFHGAIPPADSVIFPSFTSRADALIEFIPFGANDLASGTLASNLQRQVNLVANVNIVKREHQLKFGADYRRLFPVSGPASYLQQAVFFNGTAGVLSGIADSVEVDAYAGHLSPRYLSLGLYGVDVWKPSPRFTLTYGLRWEFDPPPTEANGKNPLTLQGLSSPATISVAPPNTPLYGTTHDNFAPRIGAAYQLSERKGMESIIRGGFGLFYDLGNSSTAGGLTNIPYSASKFLDNVPYPLTPDAAAAPSLVNSGPPYGFVQASDPRLELPRSYQWNVAVEQEIGASQGITTTYVGSVGRRLLRRELIIAPNPDFGFVAITRNAATSDYHALQVQFERRLVSGLQILASYTWAHSIDLASEDSSNLASVGALNPNIDRASSSFDVRHAFNAAATYEIPAPHVSSMVRNILKGWSVAPIFTARSATPVNIVTGDPTGSGIIGIGIFGLQRPDVVPNVPFYLRDRQAPGGRRINSSAFALPPDTMQGTLGRNALRGLAVYQLDLGFARRFELTQKLALLFRAELFNIFNHPNFADVGFDTVNSSILYNGLSTSGEPVPNPFFGVPSQMLGRSLGSGGQEGGLNPLYQVGGPRSIQLALKLQF
jgi:hypothetical protein